MQWHVGTSGWSYDDWAEGKFYPKDLPTGQRLAFYAQHFKSVEINNSFYRLPPRQRFKDWQAHVPPGFLFAVKGSRYITHMKRLKEPEAPVELLMERVGRLRKMGPIVFQLPPKFHKNTERLQGFLKTLPKRRRFAIEFRDTTWHDEEVYALLRCYNVAFCLFEKGALRSPRLVTADFTYVRLHGRKEGYKGRYNMSSLRDWHGWLTEQARDVYIYFDNTDEKRNAVKNALQFQELAGI